MKLKWIVLRETLSGGRCDGRPWPPAGERIDVPDWEAEHAVAAGWAYYEDEPTAPEPASVPQPVKAPERPAEKAADRAPEKARAPEPEKTPERPADKAPDKAAEAAAADRPAEKALTVLAEAGAAAEKALAVPPPQPSDPKQAWVDYAASRGMDPEKAAAVSKADLMSRYGERL